MNKRSRGRGRPWEALASKWTEYSGAMLDWGWLDEGGGGCLDDFGDLVDRQGGWRGSTWLAGGSHWLKNGEKREKREIKIQ